MLIWKQIHSLISPAALTVQIRGNQTLIRQRVCWVVNTEL